MDFSEVNAITLRFGPYFIMVMLVLLSIFNSSLKGLVYLFGVVILFMIVKMLSALKGGGAVGSVISANASGNASGNASSSVRSNVSRETITQPPSVGKTQNIDIPIVVDPFNAALYIFTIVYLLLPMLEHGTFNVPLIIFLVCLYTHYMISMVSRKKEDNTPSSMPILFLSSLVGMIGGGFYYVFLAGNDETKQLLYYNEFNSSNRVACMRPSKTNFKCRLYKNGELVQ